MKAAEFIEHVRSLRPTDAQILASELTDAEVEREASKYACPVRLGKHARENVLEDLIWRWDCTALEIGRLRLLSAARPHFAGAMVGLFEADSIVVTRTGEIALFEHERFGDRLLECAANGERFLDALACFLGMVNERSRWFENTDEAARRCADAAGGLEYEPFYLGVVGYLEYGAPSSAG